MLTSAYTYKDTEAARLVNTSDPVIQDWLIRIMEPSGARGADEPTGTHLFCLTALASSFKKPMNAQRLEWLRFLDDDTIPFTYIIATRGFAKTTFLWAYLVRGFCLRRIPFLLYTGETGDYAITRCEQVKQELVSNPLIKSVFGRLSSRTYNGTNLAFSAKAWYLVDPKTGEPYAFCSPRGEGQQVNGSLARLNGRMQRPTMIASDDGEDRKKVDNEDLRREHQEWFEGALLPCVDTNYAPSSVTNRWHLKGGERPPWRVIVGDTLKHEGANIAYLAESSEWRGRRYPLAERREVGQDDNGKPVYDYVSLMPDIRSTAQVRRMVKNARNRGFMDRFAKEYLCRPQAEDNTCWSRAMFQYYRDRDQVWGSWVDKFIIVDPAKTSKQSSAPTAILGVAADYKAPGIYLRDLICDHLEVEEIYARTVEMAKALQTKWIAVEVTGLDDHVKYAYKSAFSSRGLGWIVQFMWLKAQSTIRGGDFGSGKDAIKRARGAQILPYYKLGQVYHEEVLAHSALEQQEISFPYCKRWDALDCAGYIPQVLEKLGRYFLPVAELDESSGFPEHSENFDKCGAYFSTEDWLIGEAFEI